MDLEPASSFLLGAFHGRARHEHIGDDDAEAHRERPPDVEGIAAHRKESVHRNTSRIQLALRSRRSSSARSRTSTIVAKYKPKASSMMSSGHTIEKSMSGSPN